MLKWAFDTFFSGSAPSAALYPLAVLLALLLAVELLGGARDWLLCRVRLGIDFALMQATVRRLHALPAGHQRDPKVSATMTQIERGIAGLSNALHDVLTRQFPALVYLTASTVAMLLLDFRLALTVIAFAPLPALLGGWAESAQRAREQRLYEQRSSVFARFNEVLTGLVAVKTSVMEEQEKRRFLSGVRDANGLVLRGASRDVGISASRNVLMLAARMLVLGVGGMLAMRGEISLGGLIAFVGYVAGVFAPVQALVGLRATLRGAGSAIERVLTVLEAQDSLGDAPDAREVGPLCGQVEFRRVGFMYRPERPVLKDVTMSVQPGEVVTLVGPSGGGKTTLMALLQRLYDPTSGTIFIDGLDIRTIKQRSLRDQIGVVLSEGALLGASVRDNLAFGKRGATTAEIEAAARAANAHDFIMALPSGYATPIGEQGVSLTSSQAKRIAIARVLLQNTPILLLDETLPEADPEDERQVQQALARLIHGRTAFIIAQRLSTIVAADRVAVFRDGTIAELGTHEELLAQQGYYASFVLCTLHGRDSTAAA